MNKILIGILFCLPLKNLKINSGYGYRIHPITAEWKKHLGVDLFAQHDTVYSILDGIVEKIDFDEQTGLFIKIRHSDHLETLYGHLSAFYVLPGDSVRCGRPIGISGYEKYIVM
ncbi:MAG: M23 family metallopeptidase [Bacteroidetes bacterium]|nr:M23 family metallopeptidase [Bacteroidota bacterium]